MKSITITTYKTQSSSGSTKYIQARGVKTDMLHKLIDIIIGAIFASTLLPVAMDALINANTSNWDTASLAMWGLLKIFVVLGTILAMIYSVLGGLVSGNRIPLHIHVTPKEIFTSFKLALSKVKVFDAFRRKIKK